MKLIANNDSMLPHLLFLLTHEHTSSREASKKMHTAEVLWEPSSNSNATMSSSLQWEREARQHL